MSTLHRAKVIVDELLKKEPIPVLEKSCINELEKVYAQAKKSIA
jgi:hypothetical protein